MVGAVGIYGYLQIYIHFLRDGGKIEDDVLMYLPQNRNML